jgi:hypothetical protein
MTLSNSSKESVEKITHDLLLIENRLYQLAWKEQNTSSRESLAILHHAQAHLNQALAALYPLKSE